MVLTLEVQHLQWVNTLSAYLVNPDAGSLNLATEPTQCGLGKWYYGRGRRQAVERLPGLAADLDGLEAPHKVLHATAISIQDMKRRGDDAGARVLFQNETLPALRDIQGFMSNIRAKVSEDVARQRQAFNVQASQSSLVQPGLDITNLTALILLGLILFFSILKPCQQIIEYSKKCREGSPEPLDLKRSDELGQLADNLADLTKHLHNELAFSKGVLEGVTVPCAVF